MTTYTCEVCEKLYKSKSGYASHKNKKNCNSKKRFIKPILKWVGGKTQILEKLIDTFPKEMNNYHEIFLGGGSVLIGLLESLRIGKIKVNGNIYAYDSNEALISVYKNIQKNPDEVYECLKSIINNFNSCDDILVDNNIENGKISKELFYYSIRNQYNTLTLDEKRMPLGSALFIFLNKTCFRGIFRVGPKGFNVPYGHYKNPEIINKGHLVEVSNLIKNVIFECCDFSDSLLNINEEDFVYLDPPYAPETKTSFVGYTEHGFNLEDHEKLFSMINNLSHLGALFMLSNSDVALVRESFTNKKYIIESIECKRTINSTNPGSKTNEVIIINYSLIQELSVSK